MPAIGERGSAAAEEIVRKKKLKRKKAIAGPPKPKPAFTPSPDQQDRSRAARERQIAESRSESPDRQDTKRSPAQQARDKAVTAETIKTVRRRAVVKRRQEGVKRAVTAELEGKGVIAKAIGAVAESSGRAVTLATSGPRLSSSAPVGFKDADNLAGRAAKDIINLPAVAVPSVYEPVAGAVEAARSKGKDTKRLRRIAKSIDETDPVYNLGAAVVEAVGGDEKAAKMRLKRAEKSATEHPGYAIAEVVGARGTAGRTLGAGMRTGVAGKTVKRAASVERAPKTLEGTSITVPREWSRDVFRKAGQALTTRQSTSPDKDRVTVNDLNTRVDERVNVSGTDIAPFVQEFAHKTKGDKVRLVTSARARSIATDLEARTGHAFTPVKVTDTHVALVPQTALSRLREHQNVKPTTTAGKVLEVTNDAFRRTVLTTSTGWALGNVAEGVVRATVNKAGPRSYLTGRKLVKRVKQLDPAKAEELGARILDGGHYSLAEKLQVQQVAQEFAGTKVQPLADAMSAVLKTPGPKQLTQLWKLWTESVFTGTRKLEQQFQIAHLGAEVRRSGLMSGRLVKLSNAAMDDAARGLTNTEAQVRFARKVQEAYGKYSAYSPSARMLMATYSPFLAWFLNAVVFVGRTLPKEHPTVTGLTAAAANATEEARKEHGMDLWLKGAVPGWLQGSIPSKGGPIRLSRFTPFGAFGNPLDTAASQVNPLLSGPLMAMKGLTWNGSRITVPGGSEGDVQAKSALIALGEFIDGTIPIVSQAKRIEDKGIQALNPLAPVTPKKKKLKATAIDAVGLEPFDPAATGAEPFDPNAP